MDTLIADRHDLLDALAGRADTLTRCPLCGEPARFSYGRTHGGHEVAGWIYEKPVLTCPRAPIDEFVSIRGALVTLTVHEPPTAGQTSGGWGLHPSEQDVAAPAPSGPPSVTGGGERPKGPFMRSRVTERIAASRRARGRGAR